MTDDVTIPSGPAADEARPASGDAPARPRRTRSRSAAKPAPTPEPGAAESPSASVAEAPAAPQDGERPASRPRRAAARRPSEADQAPVPDAPEGGAPAPRRRRAAARPEAGEGADAPAPKAPEAPAQDAAPSGDAPAPKRRRKRAPRAPQGDDAAQAPADQVAAPDGTAAERPAPRPRSARARVLARDAQDAQRDASERREDRGPEPAGAAPEPARADAADERPAKSRDERRAPRADADASDPRPARPRDERPPESGEQRRDRDADAAPDPARADASDERPAKSRDDRRERDRDAERGERPSRQPGDHGEPRSSRKRRRSAEHDRDRNDRFDRNDRGDRGDRNDRGAQQAQGGKRRDRDRRKAQRRQDGPTEPSVSREELTQMKVAELRAKAAELGVEHVGVRKAELVEAIYSAVTRAEGFRPVEGVLEIGNEGYGWVRTGNYMEGDDDAFVNQQTIRSLGLRPGDWVCGTVGPGRGSSKYPPLQVVSSVNGQAPEGLKARPRFRDLTPVYPNERLTMECGKDSITGRAIDLVSPIGKGQRGLIVSPPKAGKTTVLKKICQSVAANNPEVHLFCLLVDERPEEVTDMQRSIRGEVVASTFDMPASNHTRVAELVIERAKRLVELGQDVVVVLDSITRLARAYNLAQPASGRILSGGVDSAALYPPKKFLGAARNIEGGGSLTIIASALVDTGSKMDEVIFEEFKGTGNMELKLDRDLADRRIFPAIDPIASGTRNEDLLVDPSYQPFVWGIRRVLANMNNTERAANALVKGLRGTASNQEFLIRSAKKAAQTDYVS